MAFKAYDLNEDGYLTKKEFKKCIMKMLNISSRLLDPDVRAKSQALSNLVSRFVPVRYLQLLGAKKKKK